VKQEESFYTNARDVKRPVIILWQTARLSAFY